MLKLLKLLILVFIFAPAISQATVFTFPSNEKVLTGLKETEITPSYQAAQTDSSIIFKPNAEDLVHAQFGGKKLTKEINVVDEKTAQQILDLEKKIEQPARSARMVMEKDRVTQFDPGQNGLSLDTKHLIASLQNNESGEDMPLFVSLPLFSLADTNSIGIKELIATGESNFVGSSSNRIHNIKVGASKDYGLIIKPGEEFSFNKYLGDIDAANGYVPEMVIKREGVVPEFGGGLCQVSSTAYRAAMIAGFPITARRNHSFAVKYYAPQGTDATIYPGAQDLKFINDSPSNMLIITRVEGTKLYYDYYGTKDDRVVELMDPVQYDRKPDGSMKAKWVRKITMKGNTKEEVFNSNYVSPDLFKKVENAASTPNPDSPPQEPGASLPNPSTPDVNNPPSQ
jgi:vancomycin resistance protein YoaR